ncbi:cysteine-rich CWC family protein [Paracidovorax sp. MALMAid1276]|uniref:cysteine-rich CWC family protein n=1 Tax=Paracidovorax sp. MALMAid1276 TaxID=3411631 RepID=UPI003B9C2849
MSAPSSPSPSLAGSPARCPLCGRANQCAIAAGQPAETCWCMSRALNAEVLRALPPDLRGRACICPACGAPAEPRAPI